MKKLISHSKTYTMSENKISTNNYSSSTMPVDNEIAKLEAEFQEFIRSTIPENKISSNSIMSSMPVRDDEIQRLEKLFQEEYGISTNTNITREKIC